MAQWVSGWLVAGAPRIQATFFSLWGGNVQEIQNVCNSMDLIASTSVQFSWEHQLWKNKIHWLGFSINTTVLDPPTNFSCMVRLSSLGQFREVTSSTTSTSGPPTSSCKMIRWPSGSKLLLKHLKLDDVIPDQKLNQEQQAHELNAAHLISCWTLSTFNLTATPPSGLQQSSSILDFALHVLKHCTGSACPVAM